MADRRQDIIPTRTELAADTEAALSYLDQSGYERFGEKLALAALSAVPWVGGVLSAIASLKTEEGQRQATDLLRQWVAAHEGQLAYLNRDVSYLIERIGELGREAEERAESPEYLALVRKAFQARDRADTDEKRRMYARLLAHAAGTRLCPDDTVRLFIGWIEKYDETHFRIIRFVYQNPGCSKYEIGVELFGEPLPQDSSAEADLFRELFRELNQGGLVRQPRDTNERGQFIRKTAVRPAPPRGSGPKTLDSSFDDKPQVLSGLGEQFVHYVMDEVVLRIGGD